VKVFHILNPSRRSVSWVRSLADARRFAHPWAWVAREHVEHTETLVHWALNEGMDRIVVWGGDGTLHRVVQALHARDAFDKVQVSLVPVGTCNDLARRLGLTVEMHPRWESPAPEGKLLSLAVGALTTKDAGGKTQTDLFMNNAGFGRPKDSFDRKDPPWRTLAAFRPIPTEARWTAGSVTGLYYMALVCLGPYFSGGLHFEAAPTPEDGLLRTYFVPARSKARLAARLIAGRLGLPLADSKITKITADSLRVLTKTPVWPQVDGEPPPENGAVDMEFKVLPRRWRLWGA
jgi:diacylglycerol kinase family enzyme